MAAKVPAPAPQQKRLAGYLEWLAQAVGHADRSEPLRNYCTGLLLGRRTEKRRADGGANRSRPGAEDA